MMRQTLTLLLLWVGLAVLSFFITVRLGDVSNTNTFIQVAVSPSRVKATINNRAAKIGKNMVAPGNYQVSGSFSGFASQTQSVTVAQGQTVYVGLVLKPNTPETQNWYRDHPSDQKLSETIGSQGADYQNRVYQQNNPFLSQLPIMYGDGQGGIISINPGVSLTPKGPPAIYVNASTPQLRQGVLEYMRSHGADPATMDIVFYNQVSLLGVGATNE